MARTPRFLSVAVGLMALSTILLMTVAIGCQDSGVGRPCCTAGPGQGMDCVTTLPTPDPNASSAISDNDLKCATRICAYVQPNDLTQLEGRRAECSDSCGSDGDCPDNFLCAAPLIRGASCCKKFCIRKAFLNLDAMGKPQTKPPQCEPSVDNHNGCPNVPMK